MYDEPAWLQRFGSWFVSWAGRLAHRMRRNAMVYRLELAEGFVAFERRDYQQAHDVFKRAAEMGDPAAQYNLASLFEDGLGTAKSDEVAEYWYRKAAEQGLADAQFQLAALLAAALVARDRRGVDLSSYYSLVGEQQIKKERKRYIEAYSWAWLARRQRFSGARTAVRRLKKCMSGSEVTEDKHLVLAWQVNNGATTDT